MSPNNKFLKLGVMSAIRAKRRLFFWKIVDIPQQEHIIQNHLLSQYIK